jgi:hypothetical protein
MDPKLRDFDLLLLKAYDELGQKQGYTPTHAEIATYLGLGHITGISKGVTRLLASGHLRRPGVHTRRAIQLTELGRIRPANRVAERVSGAR